MKTLFTYSATVAVAVAMVAATANGFQETESTNSQPAAEAPAVVQKTETAEEGAGGGEAVAGAEIPRIEVCFVLDTTGSMSSLIQAAKDKIWNISNTMIAAENSPEIKFGLIGYRDRTDAQQSYITDVTELTDDVDEIYTNLMAFDANGGGDHPESVNLGLHEAVTKMDWSDDRKVLKVIFLVGDAPPHMDYEDEVQYPEICRMAMEKDLIINTIQCGVDANTTAIWTEIARKAEGAFAPIPQDAGVVAIATPFDEEIAQLNVEMNGTVLAYGDIEQQQIVNNKMMAQSAASPEAVADRAGFYAEKRMFEAEQGIAAPMGVGGGGRGGMTWSNTVVSGGGDLVQEIMDGEITIDEYDATKLPEELKTLSVEQQKLEITRRVDSRVELRTRMDELVKQRVEFINQEKAKLADAGEVDAFDGQVRSMIVDQAGRKGINYNEK